jgi:hypothetical protein
MPALDNALGNQLSLLDDMIVHIQNVTIGDVVGRTVTRRPPEDPTAARIVLRGGELVIVNGSGEVLDGYEFAPPHYKK